MGLIYSLFCDLVGQKMVLAYNALAGSSKAMKTFYKSFKSFFLQMSVLMLRRTSQLYLIRSSSLWYFRIHLCMARKIVSS